MDGKFSALMSADLSNILNIYIQTVLTNYTILVVLSSSKVK